MTRTTSLSPRERSSAPSSSMSSAHTRRRARHRRDPTRPACPSVDARARARQASSTAAARPPLQARRSGWRAPARHAGEQRGRDRRAGQARPRSTSPAPRRRAEMRAGSTLMPKPSTTCGTPSLAMPASARMPASFRPPTIHVVRPLHAGARARWPPGCPRRRPRRPRSSAAAPPPARGRSTAETYRPAPAGDDQLRPCRPRPADCASATTTQPSRRRAPPARGDVVGGRHLVVAMDRAGNGPSRSSAVRSRLGESCRTFRQTDDCRRHVSHGSISKLRSTAGAECVSAPIDT